MLVLRIQASILSYPEFCVVCSSLESLECSLLGQARRLVAKFEAFTVALLMTFYS